MRRRVRVARALLPAAILLLAPGFTSADGVRLEVDAYSITGVPTSGGTILWSYDLVLASMASFLPAHKASRLTVREVLAYE